MSVNRKSGFNIGMSEKLFCGQNINTSVVKHGRVGVAQAVRRECINYHRKRLALVGGAYKVAVLSIQYAHIAIPQLLPRCVRQIAAIGVWKDQHRGFRQCAKVVGEDIGNWDDTRAGGRLGGF